MYIVLYFSYYNLKYLGKNNTKNNFMFMVYVNQRENEKKKKINRRFNEELY